MKRILLLTSLLTGLVFTSTTAASGQSYTCTYKYRSTVLNISATVYGPDNMPTFCRAFNAGWKGRAVAGSSGPRRCAFMLPGTFDVYVRFNSPSAYWGRKFCNDLDNGNWTRIA